VFKKNISDGVESQNGSINTPLDPPLFWLDNIFKGKLIVSKNWPKNSRFIHSLSKIIDL
jgi:hypothetical protein